VSISDEGFKLSMIPLGVTRAWMEALRRQEGQCGHWSKGRPPQQCQQYLNGGSRLFLTPDNVLMCASHHDKDRLARRKK
jgi:hypothetical protein